ncbi:hypothetical protein T492DRAFT_860599 [Pavlovales sp. CCMP2436]|nr:hypothetical protein T492DRAFT_860599 [Pavlovales sp. CCMP2436]
MPTDTPLLADLFTIVGLPMPVDGADLPTCMCATCSYERALLETAVTFLSAATETLDSLDTLRDIFHVAKAAEEADEQAAKKQAAKEQAAKEQAAKEQAAKEQAAKEQEQQAADALCAQAIDDYCIDAELYELTPDLTIITPPVTPVKADKEHCTRRSTGKLPLKPPRKTPAEEDAEITLAIYKKQRRALARSPPPNPHLYNSDHCLACTSTELESNAHLALHLAAHHD